MSRQTREGVIVWARGIVALHGQCRNPRGAVLCHVPRAGIAARTHLPLIPPQTLELQPRPHPVLERSAAHQSLTLPDTPPLCRAVHLYDTATAWRARAASALR